MRKFTWGARAVLGLCLVLVFAAVAVVAQDAPTTPPAESPLSLLQALIPFAVPIILELVKFGMGKVPAWLLPVVAPLLGAVADIAINLGTNGSLPTWGGMYAGALLGAAGVGVREIADQAKQRVQVGPKEVGPQAPATRTS